MTVSEMMLEAVKSGSMVRKMFEEGRQLKAIHGISNVFDYSLGNPDLSPPKGFTEGLSGAWQRTERGLHGYMPNAGLPEARARMAEHLRRIHGLGEIGPELVVMTVGAAGALNVVLKTIVENGDEILVPAPYFMEYGFYAANHGAKVVPVETAEGFRPDPSRLAAAMTGRTKALLICSPNNPTGVVYSKEEIAGIGSLLRERRRETGQDIVLIADEPYRKIVFGDVEVPSVFGVHDNSVVVTSFSKDLSLGGERIGYLCASPRMPGVEKFIEAATLANRILGYVNAPALMQRLVAGLTEDCVDVRVYQERSRMLREALAGMGYRVVEPEGTFYLFPESPLADDLAFVEILKKQLILAVPGTGFGTKGFFRLSLCLDEDMIGRSLVGFGKALEESGHIG
ncbi:MAG: pyridoxal phosphate-dependent aminotransferase [Deltaproteobacteria bacterium]|jgi:aspartate aminotransferase|nr:pyridoxal phosphate-dependent aminotransferase [Deltaproteobacteria bacterium]